MDPTLLLEALLGLSIEYHTLSRTGIILGMTAFSDIGVSVLDDNLDMFFFDGKNVLIESDLLAEDHLGRKNFTIVHEGCHHILKMLFPKDYKEEIAARYIYRYRETQAYKSREEWQVDVLSSFLLMPKDLVIQAMDIVGLEDKIEQLNPKRRKLEYEAFCEMCSILGVSKQALSIRMKNLGLLGEDQQRNPFGIMDIFMEEEEIV